MDKLYVNKYSRKNNNEYNSLMPQWGDTKDIKVKLELFHTKTDLLLEFDIIEKELRMESKFNNDKVYEDSCVEFFVKRCDSKEYLNFEISASSFMLVGKGDSRFDRVLFSNKEISEIKRDISILEVNRNNCHWRVNISINLVKWGLLNDGENIENLILKGNFYKCGDKLKEPHYLSLFSINSESPNFHVPNSFKEILFI